MSDLSGTEEKLRYLLNAALEDGRKAIDLRNAEIERLRAALIEIIGYRDDTLGPRPVPRDEYSCPPEVTDAFDRGCRMAFHRCADRARAALALEQRVEPAK